jgi:hypothetical protein
LEVVECLSGEDEDSTAEGLDAMKDIIHQVLLTMQNSDLKMEILVTTVKQVTTASL